MPVEERAPDPGPIRPFHLPPVAAAALSNGLEVRCISRPTGALVSAALVLDAGESGVEADRAGLAVLTGDSLQGGTGRRTGSELAEALERLGTGLAVSVGWDATSVRFTSVADRFEDVLVLLSEVVRDPGFPEEEVERIRRQRLAVVRQRKMDPDSLAEDALDREVFPETHPYHRPLAGTERSVSSLERDQVRSFSGGAYGPSRGGLVVAGDVAHSEVEELADRLLGDWSGEGRSGDSTPPPSVTGFGTIVVVDRPGSVQSEIRIGHAGPPRGHPDEIPLRVANLVLGGAFTSRLNLSLREEHGFTYGARSGMSARRVGGRFSIELAVQTEVTGPALAESMSVFRRFVEEGLGSEEVERSRDYLAGVFPLRMETTSQLVARVSELLVYGLPDDYHHRYRDEVRKVSLESANAAVRAHLRPDEAAVVIVGDAGKIAGDIEALDMGTLRVTEA